MSFGASADLLRFTRYAGEVERLAGETEGPDRLHSLGLLRAVEARLDDAVLLLEGATLEAPDRADVLSDLAAAYLSRHQETGVELDLLEALRATQRAVAGDPDSAAAAFNHAETLTRFSLREQALSAWRRFLRLEPTGEWSERARDQVRRLRRPSAAARWEQAKAEILGSTAPRRERLTELVAEFPHSARRLVIEEILPAWARAHRDRHPGADRHLAIAREVGTVLLTGTGDAMIADGVAVMDAANRTMRSGALDDLATAHLKLGEGERLYYQYELDRAVPLLHEADDLFRRTGSPLWGLAKLHVAAVAYNGDPAGAAEILISVRDAFPSRSHPVLAGFCDWMLGTIESITGDSEQAIELYERALHLLERAAPDQAGPVYVLLAEAQRLLGRDEAAWRAYLPGLRWSFERGDPARYHMVLYSFTETLLERGEAALAAPFGEELTSNARKSDGAIFLAEAHLQRGRIHDRLGLQEDALAHFREAARWAPELGGHDLMRRVEATIELAEAEALIDRDPIAAVGRLDGVLASKLESGYLYQLPRVLMARATAHEERGDLDEAERDLERAITEHDRLSLQAADVQNRRASAHLGQELFDRAVTFQVDRRGSPDRALQILKRSRALWRLSPARSSVRQGGGTGRAELVPVQADTSGSGAAACEGSVRIYYAVLPERLLLWLVNGPSSAWKEVAVGEEEVRRRVRRLENAIARNISEREYRSLAGDLYELLLTPVIGDVPPGAPITFVPEDVLVHVPFAALYDASTGSYLAQRHATAIAVGLTSGPEPTARAASRRGSASQKILVVTGGRSRGRHTQALEFLPGTSSEASVVSKPYVLGGQRVDLSLSKEEVLLRLPEYDVVHFAGHGIVDGTSGRSGIALDGSGEDQILWSDEISRIDLSGVELVVLSSCRGLGSTSGSAERLFRGPAFAFISAGVPHAVATGWALDDRSAEAFTLELHRDLSRGSRVADALRRAQLAQIDSTDPERRSPSFWGAFRLISVAPFMDAC